MYLHAHHVFIHCLPFQHLCDEYSSLLLLESQRILGDLTLPPSTLSHLDRVVTYLFRDDGCWPLASSRFYLGLLPPLLPTTTPLHSLPFESRRVLACLAHCCYTYASPLTTHIWGIVTRHSHPSTGTKPTWWLLHFLLPFPTMPLSYSCASHTYFMCLLFVVVTVFVSSPIARANEVHSHHIIVIVIRLPELAYVAKFHVFFGSLEGSASQTPPVH